MFPPRLFLRRTLGDILRILKVSNKVAPNIPKSYLSRNSFWQIPRLKRHQTICWGRGPGAAQLSFFKPSPLESILGSPRIRESLSSVFMEITAAVRNNAAADQDSPHGVGEDTIRFSLGSPILKQPTFQRNIQSARHLCFGEYFCGDRFFGLVFEKSIIIHLRLTSWLNLQIRVSRGITVHKIIYIDFAPADFTNFFVHTWRFHRLFFRFGWNILLWISRTTWGLPPRFFLFFFVKDLKMKIQTLNEQALVFFGGHGWMVWDGIGIRSHNPTLVGLDPFGAGDDGIFTRKDGFRMIQKLKQPVKNALYHCFLPSWRLMKQHHTTCPLARTYVYTSSLDL